MAHVKVIRRSMRPDEWTGVRVGWLRRLIIADREEIRGWTVREGRQIADDRYEMYDEVPRPLRRGEEYFTPDGTAFLHAEARLPERFAGRDGVRLLLPTAAEMLVRINGRLQGGIDPNRETMVLPETADGAYVIDIEGYNRSKPDDDRNEETTRFKGCRQIFQGAYFVLPDPDAAELYSDVAVFWDIVKGGQFDEDYTALVSDRLYHALSMIDYDTRTGLKEAREYIEKELYGCELYRGAGNVTLLAHSHLDIAYYWRRLHAVQKNARTCLIQLELMDRYPWFSYTHTQAYLFETLEKYYPELFERVRQRAAEGRFEPVGGMYVESDTNIPSAESLVRQFLYGQRYFRDRFGKLCSNCWLPDVFGNSAILPQILKKSGIRYYVSNKMSTWNDTNRFPHNSFIWRGLDGSEVYACVPPTHFITAATPSEIMQNWAAYQDKDSGAATLCMYGYGDGGSGVTEEMARTVERLSRIGVMPKLRVQGAEEYLSQNFGPDKRLSVWDGELYLEMHRGTYTTKAELKKQNRRLEFLLRDTELVSALRWLRDGEYPAEELRALWKRLLINQFHDILPGSHIRPVFEDAMADFAAVRAGCEGLLAGEGGRPWNTLPFARSRFAFLPEPDGPDTHCGERGRYFFGDMPAMAPAEEGALLTDTDWFRAEKLESGAWRVRTGRLTVVMEADGAFTSAVDDTGREYVGGEFDRLRLFRDIPGNYDAWDILPNYRENELPVTLKQAVTPGRVNGRMAEFSCVLGTEKSTFTRVIRFFREESYTETEYHVSWHEDHVMARADFGVNARAQYALCDTGAGFICRETNRNTSWQQARFEVCQHLWTDLSETDGGVAVVNNGKYGISVSDGLLSLNLLRSTCRPDLISDRGEHDFSYLSVFHTGGAVQSGVNRLALEYNVPLIRCELPRVPWRDTGSLLLQSAKLSEDGEKLILRFAEQDGCRGVLRLPFRAWETNLLEDPEGEAKDRFTYAPFELITLAVSRRDAAEWLTEKNG